METKSVSAISDWAKVQLIEVNGPLATSVQFNSTTILISEVLLKIGAF